MSLLVNGSSGGSSGTNRNNSRLPASSSSSSGVSHLGDEGPQTQAVPTTNAAGGGPSTGGPAPKDTPAEKTREREKLREQLQKLVSNKLSTLGDLDHAGLVALEALSKMPPPPGTPVPKPPGSPTTGGNAPGGAQRPRKNLPPGLEKVPRFTGKNLGALKDTLTRFHSLVVGALPGSSQQTVNRALLRDVVFILEGSALKFYDALKDGQIQWEPVPPVGGGGGAAATEHQAAARPYFQPPSTWAQVCEAFHDHYLPAEGIARTAATLLSLSQAPGESVRSLASRQLGLTHHLNRLIAAGGGRTSFWDAMSVGLFERALRQDLKRMQSAESPCSSFENSVNRAERNAALADSTVVNSNEGGVGGFGGGGGGTAVQEGDGGGGGAGGTVVTSAVKEGSGSEGNVNPGTRQTLVHPTAAAVSTSGLEHQHPSLLRSSSDGLGDSAGVPPDGAAAASATATVAREDSPKHAGIKRSRSLTGDDLVTVKREVDDTPADDSNLPDVVSGYGKNGNGGGSYLDGGDAAASDLFGGDRSQQFEDDSHGEMMPLADDGHPLRPRGWRQESGGREWNGDFGDPREERGRGSNDPPWNRNNKNKPNAHERKRQRGGDWPQGGAGGGHPDRPWQQRPLQGNLVGDRPPCTVPQCKAINRQFHCANECFYHPEHGKFRSRGGGKRRGRASLDSNYDGYNNNDNNNFGFQGAPYNDSFGRNNGF